VDAWKLVGGLRERQLTEWRQRTGAVGGQLADRVIVIAVDRGPARVDVLLLLRLVLSHAPILAGAATSGDTGRLAYAGQQ